MSEGELLVLGGSGFLGTHVVRAARARGPVVTASRSPGPAPAARVDWIPWLAADRGTLERLLERPGLVGVILCAALARAGDCQARPGEARALNVDLPARVASGCARRGLRLVHVSTDLVFGRTPAAAGGLRESDEPRPLGVYAETKRAGELALSVAHPAALVARLPLLFGDSFGRGLGASDALLAALVAGRRVRLFVDEFRTPLDVFEAAAALVELALGEQRGVLHVAGPTRLSRFELGRLVLEAAEWDAARGVPEPVRCAELALEPPRPADAALDSTRARTALEAVLSTPREALRARPPRL